MGPRPLIGAGANPPLQVVRSPAGPNSQRPRRELQISLYHRLFQKLTIQGCYSDDVRTQKPRRTQHQRLVTPLATHLVLAIPARKRDPNDGVKYSNPPCSATYLYAALVRSPIRGQWRFSSGCGETVQFFPVFLRCLNWPRYLILRILLNISNYPTTGRGACPPAKEACRRVG